MRKITQMMLTLALFFAGVVSANAEKKYCDLSQLATVGGTNATWAWDADANQGTIEWKGLSNNMVSNSFTAGDYSSWEKICVNIVSLDNAVGIRVQVHFSDGSEPAKDFKGTGIVSLNLSEYGDLNKLKTVEWIRILGSGYSSGESHTINEESHGKAVISEIYLERPDVVYLSEQVVYEAPAGTTDINGMTGAGNIKWTISYPQLVENETLWGGNIDGDNQSVDISAYDYLHFVVSSVSTNANCGLRVFVSTAQSNDNSTRIQLYPRPIADYASVTDWTEKYMITAPGTYVLKISDYPLLRGFKALQGWNGNSGTITVSMAYVSSGDAPVDAPSGKTTLAGAEALDDPTITGFNVTALSSTNLTLEAANPNALFIANEGTLTNDKNVIVDGTCANLVLTDGFAFKAPVDFTATEASYTTTINAEAGAGTLCLPFDAALPEGVVAYNLSYTAGDAYATKTPVNAITANAPVLINGTGDATFTGAGEVKAGAENTNGALTGIFAEGNVPTGSYVLQNGEKGLGFYRVDEEAPITIKPFRAYLTADGAEVRSLGIVLGGETTAIKSVAEAEGEGAIYSLSGVRISQPTRGIYVKNGKKVVVK